MRAREGRDTGGAAATMRRRRDEPPAETNPPGARRRWQQSYRCLRRAQPGWASKRPTRPNPAVPTTWTSLLLAARAQVHGAVLHHEAHAPQGGNVARGVALHGHEVGQ